MYEIIFSATKIEMVFIYEGVVVRGRGKKKRKF